MSQNGQTHFKVLKCVFKVCLTILGPCALKGKYFNLHGLIYMDYHSKHKEAFSFA